MGTAVPCYDIHPTFLGWVQQRLAGTREAKLFDRMAERSGIAHRWSVLPSEISPIDRGGFYDPSRWPGTAARMAVYGRKGPELALAAVEQLSRKVAVDAVTHLIVASCTGFVAPGIDQIIARQLGFAPSVERLLIGFMGCYAAVSALRSARHIIRSDPAARVLVLTVELSTLHLQETSDLEVLLAMLQFGDGAAAALITAEPGGLAIERPFATTLADSDDLIRWTITDQGFAMHLSGEVPARIAKALADGAFVSTATGGHTPDEIDSWAVHAGGRSILDAVERGLGLAAGGLSASRRVLEKNGNMSSATLMFVLDEIMTGPPVKRGVALAFGPGLAAEGFAFRSAQ